MTVGNVTLYWDVWSILAARCARRRLFSNLCTREQSKIIQETGLCKRGGEVALCQMDIAAIKVIVIEIR